MRRYKYFVCARCGRTNPDYLAFGVGEPIRRTYCLDHIPRRIRLRLWLREQWNLWRGRG